ncbi:heavy-metal-associated domain-containing protein [Paraflavitalea sp. CAU 1676]|uniref:heavy-metal-associated domain-containing protein n=1 Tax=Paraflavitalea sp. CAU 1676 TaxID=3032598 RepID=UPI0023DAC9C4|nr:heavy-metal-associated domain-containing protein [Paraflavitalea sp. CAU 1676]MDF2191648.1 heavy-metal-associated domain-containing protein [Paraflavitalea sp. CAU 1676]
MKTVQFKTNIKCTGCLGKVTPGLNETAGEDNWEVDLQSLDKVLTISADDINETKIREAVEKAGYKAEKLH